MHLLWLPITKGMFDVLRNKFLQLFESLFQHERRKLLRHDESAFFIRRSRFPTSKRRTRTDRKSPQRHRNPRSVSTYDVSDRRNIGLRHRIGDCIDEPRFRSDAGTSRVVVVAFRRIVDAEVRVETSEIGHDQCSQFASAS